jgi:hypothetical protein
MAFIQNITTTTENHVEKYCKKIGKKYDIEYSELYDIWKGIPDLFEGSKNLKKGDSKKESSPEHLKKKRGPSGWNIFCSKNRGQIKAENPGLSAGEISKILGEMWGELDQGEKDGYSIESVKSTNCTHILISGPRTGEQCGQKATKEGKCTRHYNIVNGNDIKKGSPIKTSKNPPTDILRLKKDGKGNIYHPDTKLAFDNEKNVIGKYVGGDIKKIEKTTDYDLEQLKIIQKYTLQILGVDT